MTKAPVVSSAAALLATLGLPPAMGQDAANGEVAQADVLTMTCSSLSMLDAQMSAGVIHYIAGYSDGQRVALAAAGPATTEIGTGQGGGTEGLPGEAAEQTATDEVMNSEEDTSSADAGVGSTADMSAGSANEPAAGLGISVDQVLAACAEAPDSPASEVIKVARGASQPEVDPQDEDPAAEGAEGQDVGSGNTVVE